MEINKDEFKQYLKERIGETQFQLWQRMLIMRPELMGINIDTKENLCEVSIDIYGQMIEQTGVGKPVLVELGGGLPREGFYLIEAGLIEKLIVVDKCEQEVNQTQLLAKMLGLEKAVESILIDLEKKGIGAFSSDIILSRNFLYGAANSVREYMFEPGKRVYVDNQRVIENTKGVWNNNLFGVIRIITNDEGEFDYKLVVKDLGAAGFEDFKTGSLPLRNFVRPVIQLSVNGIHPFTGEDSKSTAVDYVIGKKSK